MQQVAAWTGILGLVFLVMACGDPGNEPTASAKERGDAAGGIGANASDAVVTGAGSDAVPGAGRVIGFLDRESGAQLRRLTAEFTGDLDAIRERRVLRVLVSLDRTGFFVADGQLRGLQYEMFHELGKQLDARRAPGSSPLDIVYLPLPFDALLDALLSGQGDVVAAPLAVTPERSRRVAFTEPYMEGVRQVVVAHESAPQPTRWEDLAGRTVHVVAGTSHAALLADVSELMLEAGLSPMDVVIAPRGLSTADLLDLVADGTLSYSVADDYVAELWATHHPSLRVISAVSGGSDDDLAWAVRPGNPQLEAFLDDFLRENRKGTVIGNILYKRYFGKTDWLRNPLVDIEHSTLGPLLPSLKRYAQQYGFDWRLMAAQAYQESRLDPDAVSRSGAVGLMQLLPSTAADMGFTDLKDPDTSLHAGIKYMAWLREHFFDDPDLPAAVAADFTLAGYNAGPSRVKRWREEAPARGLDPDRWFGHVERIALDDVGMQPVQYVGHINKYYVILDMLLEDLLARSRGIAELEAAAGR